jgi:chromosome segregation ATPase
MQDNIDELRACLAGSPDLKRVRDLCAEFKTEAANLNNSRDKQDDSSDDDSVSVDQDQGKDEVIKQLTLENQSLKGNALSAANAIDKMESELRQKDDLVKTKNEDNKRLEGIIQEKDKECNTKDDEIKNLKEELEISNRRRREWENDSTQYREELIDQNKLIATLNQT